MQRQYTGRFVCPAIIVGLAVLGFASPSAAYAQQVLGSLTTADGLSDSRVFVILQDHRGFMWFATRQGLNRYDGHTVTTYRAEPGNPDSLSDDIVEILLEDSSGTLWVGTHTGGVNRFDRNTETFTRFTHDPDDPNSLSPGIVQRMFEDGDGFIWFGTERGASSFDPASGRMSRHDEAVGNHGVVDFADDPSGGVWVATNGGVYLLERESGLSTGFLHDADDPRSLGDDRVPDLLVDRNGVLWLATMSGLNRFDRDTRSFTRYRLDSGDSGDSSDLSDATYRLLAGSNDTLWVGTEAYVHRFDTRTGSSESFALDPPSQVRFGGTRVMVLEQTADGAIWVGALGGLFRIDPGAATISAYPHDASNPFSLSDDRVRDLYIDRSGLLWVGTVGGVNKILPTAAHVTNHFAAPGDPTALRTGDIRAVCEAPSGDVWVVTIGNWLHRLDHGSGRFTRYRLTGGDDELGTINAVYADSEGNVWLGTETGLWRYAPSTGALDQFVSVAGSARDSAVFSIAPGQDGNLWLGGAGSVRVFSPRTAAFLPDLMVPIDANATALRQAGDGSWWIGTDEGLLHYDAKERALRRFHHDPSEDPTSLSHDVVNTLLVDSHGVLWVGTDRSFHRLDAEQGGFSRFFEVGGPLDVPVYGLFEGDDDDLWVVTRDALWNFDPSTGSALRYGRADGLAPNTYSQRASSGGRSGRLYLGGIEGLSILSPRGLDGGVAPQVAIVDLRVTRRNGASGAGSVLRRSLLETEELVLAHSDRDISLSFVALSFAAPERHRFRYMLERYDEEWTEVGADRRTLTYPRLPAGRYTLRVQAANHRGTWNDEGARLHITVTPSWWETAWFRVVALVVAALGVVTAHRARTRVLKRRTRGLEREIAARVAAEGELRQLGRRMISAQEDDRARIARELHDDVNQRLAAFSIEMGVARRELGDASAPTTSKLQELQGEIEQLSEDIRQVSHDLHPATLEQLGVSAALRALAREVGGHAGIAVDIAIDTPADDALTSEAGLCMYRVAQEALRNVTRHAEATMVRLSVVEVGASVCLCIIDNGKGFTTGEQATGLGLASMRERARLLDGTLEVLSEPGKGTEVRLRLPGSGNPSA